MQSMDLMHNLLLMKIRVHSNKILHNHTLKINKSINQIIKI
jgi:hypothetical protein